MILAFHAFTGVLIDPATMPKPVQGAKPAVGNGPGCTGPEQPAPLGSSPARCSTSSVDHDVGDVPRAVATTVKGDPKMAPLPVYTASVPQSAPVLPTGSPAVVAPAAAAAAPQASSSRSALTDTAIVHLGLYVLKAQVHLKSATGSLADAECRNYFGEVRIF